MKLKITLFLIFKTSLQRGTFSNMFKIAKVTPLFKSGDGKNVTNCISFSVLQYFQKFLSESYTI